MGALNINLRNSFQMPMAKWIQDEKGKCGAEKMVLFKNEIGNWFGDILLCHFGIRIRNSLFGVCCINEIIEVGLSGHKSFKGTNALS